ncbi:MAG: 4Fe-4S binding protein [Bacteroidales bacterium]|nr:4Fe-4S binding protein [Bacteroidales bacterium]
MKNGFYSTGSILRSSLLALPMVLISMMMLSKGGEALGTQTDIVAYVATTLFYSAVFFMMLYKGSTDKWRAVAFTVSAVFFTIAFMHNLVELRGSVTYSDEEMMMCELPFCHIVTTMVLIPAAIKQTIIFPGSILTGFASISSMFVIVFGSSIILGRGFCSWGCFYGGWDDGFSRITRKPFIKAVNTTYRWFAFAMLIVMALWSAATLMPEYCNWLCPFKLVTERDAIVDTESLLKNIVMMTIFAVLVVILPLLTKKRIQCATFCPMGAFESLFNKVSIFQVKNNESRCIGCGKCQKACPLLAISNENKPMINCAKCGKCVDECPTGAMQFHIKGTPLGSKMTTARLLFLYPSYILTVTLLGGSMMEAIKLFLMFVNI